MNGGVNYSLKHDTVIPVFYIPYICFTECPNATCILLFIERYKPV